MSQRSTSPKTMSSVPMIATASASMWPLEISFIYERWQNAGERSFMR